MKCNACGNVIPSELLRQERFICPSCGKSYRRGTQAGKSSSVAQKTKAAIENKPREMYTERSDKSSGAPKWLLGILACITIIALILSGIAFISSTRSSTRFDICGQVKKEIEGNKTVSISVEIPEQPNTDYMVAIEVLNTAVVSCGIKDKTPTSFTILAGNRYKDARTPVINWAVIPCSLPAANGSGK